MYSIQKIIYVKKIFWQRMKSVKNNEGFTLGVNMAPLFMTMDFTYILCFPWFHHISYVKLDYKKSTNIAL